MYIGRIVSVAQTKDGRLCVLYRVSSRSFPNRTAVVKQDTVSIIPKPGFEGDVQRNPYIAYNCLRLVCGGRVAVMTNGSQTDPIAEKIASGMTPRDALAVSLLALDYEKDDYQTPRVCAVADRRDGSGYLGVVREDGLEVRRVPLEPGRFAYVATYEENGIGTAQTGAFAATDAESACRFILGEGVFAERENPITAVAALATGEGFQTAVVDAVA